MSPAREVRAAVVIGAASEVVRRRAAGREGRARGGGCRSRLVLFLVVLILASDTDGSAASGCLERRTLLHVLVCVLARICFMLAGPDDAEPFPAQEGLGSLTIAASGESSTPARAQLILPGHMRDPLARSPARRRLDLMPVARWPCPGPSGRGSTARTRHPGRRALRDRQPRCHAMPPAASLGSTTIVYRR